MSLNVVREALNRLTGEQLVRAEPKIGFTVTDLSLEGLSDLVAVRVAIESAALRWAIERGDVAWESQVVAAHYRLANTPETEGQPPVLTNEWISAHSEFHTQILSACGSPRMGEITRSLSDAAQIYRRWSLSLPHPDRDVPRARRPRRGGARPRCRPRRGRPRRAHRANQGHRSHERRRRHITDGNASL